MIKSGDNVTVNGTVTAQQGGFIQIRMSSGAECWIKTEDINTHWPCPPVTEYFVDRVRANNEKKV